MAQARHLHDTVLGELPSTVWHDAGDKLLLAPMGPSYHHLLVDSDEVFNCSVLLGRGSWRRVVRHAHTDLEGLGRRKRDRDPSGRPAGRPAGSSRNKKKKKERSTHMTWRQASNGKGDRDSLVDSNHLALLRNARGLCLPRARWFPWRYPLTTKGMYTGQFVYCTRRATLSIGNVLLLHEIPEGVIVCNIEHHVGSRGMLPLCWNTATKGPSACGGSTRGLAPRRPARRLFPHIHCRGQRR